MARGQFFSYDAIIAGAIFLLALALLMSYWQGTERQMETDPSLESIRISETLLTAGSPLDWEKKGNVSSIGIAEKTNSRTISLEKLSKLRDMAGTDYENLKSILVVENEFWFEFSGEDLDCNGPCSFGKTPPQNAEISSATRLVVLNGKPASLRIVLWKGK